MYTFKNRHTFTFIFLLIALVFSASMLAIWWFNPSVFNINKTSEVNSAQTGKIEVINEFNKSKLVVDKNHFALEEITLSLQKIDLSTLNQKITIKSGLPDILETGGTFSRGNGVTSSSNFTLSEQTAVINIFVDPLLGEDDMIYEATRNYYWALLALDQYSLNPTKPEYAASRKLAADLTIKSYDENVPVFVIVAERNEK